MSKPKPRIIIHNHYTADRTKRRTVDSDREVAENLIRIDNRIWNRLGARSGSQIERNWEKFKSMVAASAPRFVPKGVAEIIEDENHHSFLRALRELGRLD
jgi:hypothetical protein